MYVEFSGTWLHVHLGLPRPPEIFEHFDKGPSIEVGLVANITPQDSLRLLC